MDAFLDGGRMVVLYNEGIKNDCEKEVKMETRMNMAVPATTFTLPYIGSPVRVSLPDGTPVILRQMEPGDIRPTVEMHERLSADTLYWRYLHPYKPTLAELDGMARMRREEGAAFIAVIEGPAEKVIGLGLYRRDPREPAAAQFAVLIQDEYQGQGLGRALIQSLVQHALANEISFADATVHPENRKMMHLIQKGGLRYTAKLVYGAIELRVFLREPRN